MEQPKAAEVALESGDEEALAAAIRSVVFAEVQARVAEKAEELWARGKQAMAQMAQSHKETTRSLMEEVGKCQERQRVLEVENESLKDLVRSLSVRLKAEDRDDSTAPGSSPPRNESPEPCRTPPPPGLPEGLPLSTPTDGLGSHPGFAPSPMPTVPGTPATPATPALLPPAFINSLVPGAPIMPVGPPARFSFTLRKADGVELGLHVSHSSETPGRGILIEAIRPQGAMDAWNRQWQGSTLGREKVVQAGDVIVSVNGVEGNPTRMLEECKNKQLLKIEVARGEQSGAPNPAPELPQLGRALRAEATAFCPKAP